MRHQQTRQMYKTKRNRKSAWDDFDDDDDQLDKEEPLFKITYSDKMIVSVMGPFSIFYCFHSTVLWFFGYDVTDAQLRQKLVLLLIQWKDGTLGRGG